jgi:hypothetical protein
MRYYTTFKFITMIGIGYYKTIIPSNNIYSPNDTVTVLNIIILCFKISIYY